MDNAQANTLSSDSSLEFMSLLSVKTKLHHRSQSRGTRRAKSSGPMSADFFDDFDQGESTFSKAFFNGRETRKPFGAGSHAAGSFFAETASAGSRAAWQTFYPANPGHVAHAADWELQPTGWVQKYSRAMLGGPGPNPASWFDSSVLNYDSFGREQLPPLGTARRLLDAMPGEGWVERSVNSALQCKEVGCTARSQVEVYDPDKEQASLCSLNIHVHPTDYDNEWSKEFVKYWKVNDLLATGTCDPHARGCNATAQRQLVPCLQDLGVDRLLSGKGYLVVEGQINQMVDECPYDGNLLSGVATVTCMVRNIPPVRQTTTTTPALDASSLLAVPVTANSTLRCGKPGCQATSRVDIDPTIALAGGTCLMNISVVQTDFDESVGVPEEIEFISLEGVGNISTSIKPGRNPCTEEFSTGKHVPTADRVFQVISNRDVTAQILEAPVGSVLVGGKISDQVDECGSNGALLDGFITVTCLMPSGGAKQ